MRLKKNKINLSICRGDRPIHVSYDIDSLDPKETPSTGTPGKDYANSHHRFHSDTTDGKLIVVNKMQVDSNQLAPIVHSSLQCINHFSTIYHTSEYCFWHVLIG